MPDETKREIAWGFYFNTTFRARYFARQVKGFRTRISILSGLIAVCASAPVLNFIFHLWDNNSASVVLGCIAALAGIYLGMSDIAMKLATAIRASDEWNEFAIEAKLIWNDSESGKDVQNKMRALENKMLATDKLVNQRLDDNKNDINLAWKETEVALTT